MTKTVVTVLTLDIVQAVKLYCLTKDRIKDLTVNFGLIFLRLKKGGYTNERRKF